MFRPTQVAAPGRARPHRARGFKAVVALATSVVAMATTLATAPMASAALAAVGPVDPTTHFPAWYQDATGLQLQPCLDGAPLCFATPADLVAPDGEFFYNNAQATVGDANIVLALEGAYLARGTGQEIAFGRVRFFNKVGLTPGADYTVTHPYGTDVFTADASGAILGKNATQDIGCMAPPCASSFGLANNGRVGPFITWDTFGSATGAPPAGYVGDGVTPHRIAPVGGVDYLRVEGPNINKTRANWCPGRTDDVNCIQTNLFTVEGKVIAGPSAVVNPDAIDFGHQQAGTTSAQQTVTLTSRGAADVQVGTAAISGPNASDYTINTDSCTNLAVAPGTTCSLGVTFTPAAIGASSATLTIPDNTAAGSHVVTLKGTTAPAATLDSTSLDFPSQKVSTTGTAQVLRVSNTGSADLVIAAPSIAGAGASSYKVSANTCTVAIAPNGSCTISVSFTPTAAGAQNATLTIGDNGPSTHTVALTGAGIVPTVSLSRTTVGFPDQLVTTTSPQSTVTVTNTGNASLVIQDVAIGGPNASDFALGTNTCAAGFEVVPSDSCSVGVTVTPSVTGSRNGTLTIATDGGTKVLPLSGNGVKPVDTIAPSAPTGLTAASTGANGISLSWTPSTDNVGVAKYEVYRDGAAAAVGTSTTASFADSGLAEASKHTYTVKAFDAAGNISVASTPASATTKDVTAPSIPAGVTATATGTSTINVSWAASTDNVGVTGYRVYRDGAATAVGSPTTTSFTDTGLAAGSAHSYTVAAIDAAANLTATSAPASATTAAAPVDPVPSVTARTPAVDATGVSTTGNITATFSEAVTGVSATTFTLKNAATGAAVGATSVAYNATTRVATFDPNVTLANGTTYTATLTTGILDSAKQPLPATTWSFTTVAAGTDTTVPSISARTPGVNGTGFSQTGNITATFSEAVTGVSATTFTLKNAATGAAVGATSVAYNATTRVATFDPNVTLAADTKYTASLTTAIKDAAGNALPATSWTFTTGPVPTVSSRTPGTNATGASQTGNITATFSEAVTGVSATTFTLKNAATGAAVGATSVAYNTTTRVATFDPNVTLAADTKYTASLTTAIKDAGGNPIAATSWTFTTGPVPTVTARTPASGATGVSRTANVTATFSEAVTGWTTTTATVKNAATGVVQTAVVSYNATSRVVTINPSATLAASTKFTVTLSNGIKDTIGNPIAATTWSFTTGTV